MSEHDATLELKAATITAVDPVGRTVVGIASTSQVDLEQEAFAPGAWDDDLKTRPLSSVGVHWMHRDGEIPLGNVLELTPTPAGLRFKVAILDTPRGTELIGYLRSQLARGIPPGVSVGFRTLAQSWRKLATGTVRIIEKAALRELSFTLPGLQANPGAIVQLVKTADPETAIHASLSATALALRATADALEANEAAKTTDPAAQARHAALGAELDALQPFVDPRLAALDREIAEAKALLWGWELEDLAREVRLARWDEWPDYRRIWH